MPNSLPTVKIRRLRYPASNKNEPLVAITVPGRGNKAHGLLMTILGDTITRLPEHVWVEQVFFDPEPTATSVEMVAAGTNLTTDQAALEVIEAAYAAALWQSHQRTSHPTGVRTHAVQVIR